MNDTTLHTQASLPANPPAALERLSRVALDLAEKLHANGEMSEKRDLSVPPGALENLKGVAGVLRTMPDQLNNVQIELQQLRELARTTEIINSQLDLDLVLNDVVDTVISLTGAERGYIVLKDPITGSLDFRVARDKNQH